MKRKWGRTGRFSKIGGGKKEKTKRKKKKINVAFFTSGLEKQKRLRGEDSSIPSS